jgi:hypothetical protein
MRNRLSPTERGYDGQHRALHRRLAITVANGTAVCWRCWRPIHPAEPWDLGHDDHNRGIYRGAEHRACNRSAAARKRWRIDGAQVRQTTTRKAKALIFFDTVRRY